MSYETTNYLPKGISKRQAVEFALLLGYEKNGTYAHMGSPQTISMIYQDTKNYRSWQTVELSIGFSGDKGCVYVGTRTRVGRSHYDFELQNRTVREFRKRFGGTSYRDGGKVMAMIPVLRSRLPHRVAIWQCRGWTGAYQGFIST